MQSSGKEKLDQHTRETLDDLFSRIIREEGSYSSVDRLKQFVLLESQSKNEVFTAIMDSINLRINALINQGKLEDFKTALPTLEMLISIDDPRNSASILQWKNTIERALRNARSHGPSIIKRVAVTLGLFVRSYRGSLTKEFVVFEISNALEGMQKHKPILRQSGVLVFEQLVQQVPDLLKPQDVEGFMEVMWGPLLDPNTQISCLQVLRWCLKYMQDRQPMVTLLNNTFKTLYDNIEKDRNSELVHASLLVLTELIQYSSALTINADILARIVRLVFSMRDHKAHRIRKAVVQIIPLLVQTDVRFYTDMYLREIITYYTEILKKDRSMQPFALISIGELSVHLKERIVPCVRPSFDAMYSHLKPLQKRTRPVPQEVFQCLSLFAKAYGAGNIANEIKSFIGQLGIIDFSKPLVQCFAEISGSIPSLHRFIEDLLMVMFYSILTGRTDLTVHQWDTENFQNVLTVVWSI
eukprot:TRINITY_DN4873_c0_g2_i4.p1 TRINITY_DN4873_c0_g2~~TRINITY_DN4873_c0_g2_i4.p1  ORF type:complete len:469 (+),score=26.51 TRINITY_DN4873_c0_g2_i4:82-1488(+)